MQAPPTTFQAIILGLLQGITEFLPISSTAHLRIVPALAGWDDPGAAFTAVSQLGTLAATIVYFWRDLVKLAAGALDGLRKRDPLGSHDSRLAFGIVVGTIPIGILGKTLKPLIEKDLRSLMVVALAMFLGAVLLFIAERTARHVRDFSQMTFKDALIVGCGQTLALIPGMSRSGSTIMTALFIGLKRDTAARFSFLLSLPAVAAAGLLEMKDVLKNQELGGGLLMPTLIATVVAFVSGFGAIAFLIRFLQSRSTMVFIVYRVALGGLLLALLGTGRLDANAGVHEKPALEEPTSRTH